MARTYTTRQQTARLAAIDTQLTALRAIVAIYEATFTPDVIDVDGIPADVYDTWNATHSTITALETERRYVEDNPRVFTGAAADTWALVCANID